MRIKENFRKIQKEKLLIKTLPKGEKIYLTFYKITGNIKCMEKTITSNLDLYTKNKGIPGNFDIYVNSYIKHTYRILLVIRI
jgi:hypothetical protein